MSKDLPVDIFFHILVCTGWYWIRRGSTCWYWVSIRQHWLVLGCTWSVEGGISSYLVLLGQNRVVLVASVICFQKLYGLHGLNHQIIQYWVSRGQYWLVLGGTGSEQGGTCCQLDELSENKWFAWSRSSNYWIVAEGKSEYGQTDTQTHRQAEFPLVDSTPSVEGVE